MRKGRPKRKSRTGRRKRNPGVEADQAKYIEWLKTVVQSGMPLPNPVYDEPLYEARREKKGGREEDIIFGQLDFDELEVIGYPIWDYTRDDDSTEERMAEIRSEWVGLSVDEKRHKLKEIGRWPGEKTRLLGHPAFNMEQHEGDRDEDYEGSSEAPDWEEE